MKRLAIPLLTAIFVLTALVATLPGRASDLRPENDVYTCEPIYFPDGGEGVAIVNVELSTSKPEAYVTVTYYSEGSAQYLGRYDTTLTGEYPRDIGEAEQFAIEHYNDRW